MLSVDDNRVWVDALSPLFTPVLAHVVPDLPDVHRVVDDGLDRHAAKSISRLGFLVLSIQLIGDPLQLGRWRTCGKSSEPVRPRSG